jgi:DNA-binding CsgD family transcriptional regulator
MWFLKQISENSGERDMVFNTKQWEYLRKIWHLTPREVEVAKLVCDGIDNEQIGKKLSIEYNTVRAHLGNIFRKVGVKGKAGVVLEFIQMTQRAGI